MAIKNLGQEALAATTLTDVYTVPTGKSTVLSTVHLCNRSPITVKVRVSHAIGGAAYDAAQELIHDAEILGNDFIELTSGITMDDGDILRCYAEFATVSVNVYGEER